jgi:excinuclease UvrABC nuclease subunit
MGGKSREERWENQECVECGAKIEAGVRCEKHAKEHAEKQKFRRRRRKNSKLCRVPGCRRKRVGKLATCFEHAFGCKKADVKDWVAMVFEGKKNKLRTLLKM